VQQQAEQCWAAAGLAALVRLPPSCSQCLPTPWCNAALALLQTSPASLPLPFPFPSSQDEIPENLANASNTITWWQSRQAEVQSKLKERRAALGQVRWRAWVRGCRGS